ncbi:Competence protein A [Botrimarina colliarenosi]|uniref:Competence protein A n=1 Tax=Botrimarina colliarenosi TaxID=2528001 RepID=A0A5C6AF92_9BACT|nr:hypothetical protein [Botrimarina colliarenosi]TWT98087.1 Competence protein A [Botrimarina colliarenosi]
MIGNAKRGWIGVDIGQRAIKVAQLTRERGRLRLVAAAVCDWPAGADATQTDRLAEQFLAARSLAERLRGDRVAAAFSMSACQVEPTDSEAADPVGRCSSRWTAGPASAYTLSTDAARVEAAVDGMAKAGWLCEAIDGQPLAIARATQLTENYDAKELVGALDLGETSATFVAAAGGAARYVRRLAFDGMDEVLRAAGDALCMAPDEAGRLLRRQGTAGPPFAAGEQRVVHEAVRGALRPLAQEIQRTLEHLGGKLKTRPPERLVVFGAGGVAPGLAEVLGSLAGLSSEPWRAAGLERSDGLANAPDCLLAQAIMLSALAWEARA